MALDVTSMVVLGWVFALIMCFAMGANDESMGSAYGSRAFSLTTAVIVGASVELIGSVLMGENVATTIQGKLFDTKDFANNVDELILVFLCATASASIFLIIASYFGWPVSTTHGIVGAVAGAAVGAKGFKILEYTELLFIVGSWFSSPISGAIITSIFFFLIDYTVMNRPNPYRAALRMAPLFYAGGVTGALSFVLFKGKPLPADIPLYWTGVVLVGVFLSVALLSELLVVRVVKKWIDNQDIIYVDSVSKSLRPPSDAILNTPEKAGGFFKVRQCLWAHWLGQWNKLSGLYERLAVHEQRKVEGVFVMLQMMTAPLVAFARGANDVSNGIGPLAAIVALGEDGESAIELEESSVAFWMLAVGGVAIACGLFVLGRKVIKNIGDNITSLTPSRGVCVEVGTAITVLAFSSLGVPISSTHTLVGCIFSIGLCMKLKRRLAAKTYARLSYDETSGLLELGPNQKKDALSDPRPDQNQEDLNWSNSLKIFISWIVTIPAAAVLAGLSVLIVTRIFE